MHKIRIPHIWSVGLLLIFMLNISLFPTSLSVPDSDLQNRDGTQDAVQDQKPRYEYDIAAVTPNQRGFNKAMANGIPTLTEWWSPNFDFRRMVNVTEPGTIARSQEPVTLNVNFSPNTAYNNSLRIAYYNATISSWVEVPSQVWQNSTFQGSYYDEATITFFVDSTISQEQTYYLYYDDNDQGFPSGYTDNINATAVDGPALDDTTLPDVTLPNGTLLTSRDTIYVNTTDSNGIAAAILLTDRLRAASDWGGPSCSLIRATYGTNDTLDTNLAQSSADLDQFMLIGDLAIDPTGADTGMGSSESTRANLAPDNPAEAWVPGAGVWILDDGPLFTRIKIVTSDGGYRDHDYLWGQSLPDETFTPARDPSSNNGGSGFVNYTFFYTFFYHGNNLLANLNIVIEANEQYADPAVKVHFKNYGDWPHMVSLTTSGTPGSVDSLQGVKAWNGVLRGLFNESSDYRRHDFPLEPWVAWYDNGSYGGQSGIGVVAKTNPTGWEVYSLVVSGMGDNLVLQQIVREGHQGDFFVLENGQHLLYDYYIYTSAFGQNFAEIRNLSTKVNNPLEVSMGVEELYEHNILTVQTMVSPHSWPTDSISNVNVTIQKTGYTNWGLTNVNGEYQFTQVPDGTVLGGDPYTITSTYTIGTNPAYTVNITTNYDINHSIDRAPTLQINCDLSRLQITATNADGGSALNNALVRMRRPPPNQAENVEGTTGAGGIVNFILYNGSISETYTVEVEYPEGRPATRVTASTSGNSTIIIPDADGSETISCVIDTHMTALIPANPTSAFVQAGPEDVITFSVQYMDTTEDPSIPITGAIANRTWILWNVTDNTLVGSDNATDEGGGYYNHTVNMNTLDPTKAYTLAFTLDKDTPIDYSPASFVYSITINLIPTELSIFEESPATGAVGVPFTITLHFNDSDGNYIPGATFTNTTTPSTGITVGPANYVVDGNYTVDLTPTIAGAYTILFNATKPNYRTGVAIFTLAIGPVPAHLKLTNTAGAEVTQATIAVGESYTLKLRYETPAGGDINATSWDWAIDPFNVGLNNSLANITEVNPGSGSGNYTVDLKPSTTGTYTIIFTFKNGTYTDGVAFFTLLMGDIPASLIVDPGSAGIFAGGTATFTLSYSAGSGATISYSINPSGPTLYLDPIGGGSYTASGEFYDPGTYTINFRASKSDYTDGRVTAVLNVVLRPTKLEITSPSAAEIIAEETYPLNVTYTDTSTGGGVGGGTISVVVTPTTGMTYEPGVHLGSGIYQIVLYGDSIGTYTVTVTLSRYPYRRASVNFFLTVKPIPTTLNILELQGTNLTTSLARPINETFQVTLNFARDENASRSVENATISLLGVEEWRMADYLGNGTYVVEVSTGDILGIYPTLVMASKLNYEVGRASFEFHVRPFSTELLLWGREEASATVPVGETLELEVYYNNTDWGVPISGAELVVSGLPLTNERTISWEKTGDIYRASIGTGVLPETKPFTLTITGRHPPQFDPASMTFELTITTIPFRAQDRPTPPGVEPTLRAISVPQDQKANVTIQLWDTYYNTTIENAEVTWTLYVTETEEQGSAKAGVATPTIYTATVQSPEDEWVSGEFEYVGNGTYTAFVPAKDLDLGTYKLEITASKDLYGEQTFTMDYVVTPKPGTPTVYFLGLASIIVGSIGGFYSWYFYFRWPPQVRYIRKALKRLEAGSQVEEGRFPSKEEHRQTITEEQLRLPRQLME